jgi:hypothetical protein
MAGSSGSTRTTSTSIVPSQVMPRKNRSSSVAP